MTQRDRMLAKLQEIKAKLRQRMLTSTCAERQAQGLRQRFPDLGQEIPPRDHQTPEALGAYQKAEIDKWWPIVKAANIKPD